MHPDDEGVVSTTAILIGFIVIGVIVGGFAIAYFKPVWLGFERKAFKASHQYVEGKQTQLMTLGTEYGNLTTEIAKYNQNPELNAEIISGLKAQQKSIVSRIKMEAQRIPKDELPESVRKLLEN